MYQQFAQLVNYSLSCACELHFKLQKLHGALMDLETPLRRLRSFREHTAELC